jgi:hypothetical protein
MGLAEIYLAKYGGKKTAKPDFAPGVKEQGLKALSKKNPTLAAAAAATGEKGVVKGAQADAIFRFKDGKKTASAFMDELRKLNSADAMLMERVAHEESPLAKAIREIG